MFSGKATIDCRGIDNHKESVTACLRCTRAGEDRGATIRHDDRRVAPASRVAVARGVHTRGDGVDERVLETGLQPPRGGASR